MPSPPHSTIAIIGAGPVALTLANILQNNNIPFTIYEASSSVRTQGGSLDLHPSSGQLALKEAGLWDAFTQLSRPESDVQKIVALDGEVLWDGNTTDKQDKKEEERFEGRPEIDRRALVELLGPHQTIDQVAADADTIAYEILTRLGSRLARHYIGDGAGTGAWSVRA